MEKAPPASDDRCMAIELSTRRRRADRVPPTAFFVTSAVFHYLGPSLAVLLFAHVSALGVAWLRIVTAAVVLGVVAPSVGRAPDDRSRPPKAAVRARRSARPDERLVLPGRRAVTALDSGCDRIPRSHPARRDRLAGAAEPCRPGPRGGRRGRADRRPAGRRAARLRVRLRQLRRLRALRRARSPRRAARRRPRPARGGDARRGGGGLAARSGGRNPGVRASGLAALGDRR